MDGVRQFRMRTPSLSGLVDSAVVFITHDDQTSLDQTINRTADRSAFAPGASLQPTVTEPLPILLPTEGLPNDHCQDSKLGVTEVGHYVVQDQVRKGREPTYWHRLVDRSCSRWQQ